MDFNLNYLKIGKTEQTEIVLGHLGKQKFCSIIRGVRAPLEGPLGVFSVQQNGVFHKRSLHCN
jgi:hypothetical protein